MSLALGVDDWRTTSPLVEMQSERRVPANAMVVCFIFAKEKAKLGSGAKIGRFRVCCDEEESKENDAFLYLSRRRQKTNEEEIQIYPLAVLTVVDLSG